MNALIHGIIKHKRPVVIVFVVLAIVSAFCIPFVKTNYNMVDYLPPSAQSTKAVEIMNDEFSQEIPNTNVLVHGLTIAEGLEVKERITNVPGVKNVMWLDNVADTNVPFEVIKGNLTDNYFHPDEQASSATAARGTALFQATVAEGEESTAIPALRELIDGIADRKAEANISDKANAVSGNAVDTAQMQASTVEEVMGAVFIIVPIIAFLLIISTTSWVEPLLFVAAIGISILFNMGTNIFLGEVSFITYSVSPILQLAVSLDYAIFLLHAFADERHQNPDVQVAMERAMRRSVSTIAASALTTLFGFATLAFMQFQIGADLGLNLVKGIAFSFITVVVFLPALTMYTYKAIDKTSHKLFMPSFHNVDRGLSKVRVPALVLVAVLIVPAFLGQMQTHFAYANNVDDPTVRTGADRIAVVDEFGEQNAIAVLVPKGEVAKEAALSDDLEKLPRVDSVLSYANMVGAEIPHEFVGSDITDQFYSDNWARIIAYVDTPAESPEAFATVEDVLQTTSKHYGTYYAAGQTANLYDMSSIISVDNVRVSVLAVVAIFIVLLITFKSLGLSLALILAIETGIWINLSIPYFMGDSINFIGYLIINTVQLGATIDYGILITTRYMAYRKLSEPRAAIRMALGDTFRSVLISAAILSTAGFALGVTSSLSAVNTLGLLLGRGAIISLIMVTCFLPALLVYCDGIIRRTTLNAHFFKPERKMQ